MESEKEIEIIKKNLENPVFTNLDVLLDKSRVKLISFSLLGLFIYNYDIDIEKGLSFLGISIKDITVSDISLMLIIVLGYLLVNFIWMSWNRLIEWNIRRTGTESKLIKAPKTLAGDEFDYPNNDCQSSLYYYWLKKEREILDLEKKFNNIEINSSNCRDINENLKSLTKLLSNPRFKASLDKFDEAFWQKIKSENARWIVFDFLLPILICILSIGFLSYKIFYYI